MEEEVVKFIEDKGLSPFNDRKTIVKQQKNIFKTSDARNVATKFVQHISREFVFADTSNILLFFEFTDSVEEIKRRQKFFFDMRDYSNDCLKNISLAKTRWKIPYTLIAATEDEQTFIELKNRGVPARLIISDSDISNLEQYDLVYVIDCDEYSRLFEQLHNTFFVSGIDEIYLERNLVRLSEWKDIIQTLGKNEKMPQTMKDIVKNIENIFPLLDNSIAEKIDQNIIEKRLDEVNSNIEKRLQDLTISGSQMMALMQKAAIPQQINNIINEEITKIGLPVNFFRKQLPVQIDEEEVDKAIKKQTANSSTRFVRQFLKEKQTIQQIPKLLGELSNYILYLDFVGGMNKNILDANKLPEVSDGFSITDAENRLISNPQKISFNLSRENPCSILTGANSGGKTTLLEHIIQLIIEMQLGMLTKSDIRMPIFSEVYYFAKNKGSTSKGAFETLLTELSTIKPGKQTLILADEVEAVTEPGVAGKIMKSTIEYFVPQGCFIVLATHLGKELQQNLPKGARIDGIEATGLDSEFNLIVNHNPVLGRLARSTPELIVEKMAKSQENEYLKHLYTSLKSAL